MKLATRGVNAWNRFWFDPGPAAALGICRVLFFGTLLLWQLRHDYSPWGAYSSVFWMPIWLFDRFSVPALPAPTIAAMQAIWKVSVFASGALAVSRAADAWSVAWLAQSMAAVALATETCFRSRWSAGTRGGSWCPPACCFSSASVR